jgi:hypothetical protein
METEVYVLIGVTKKTVPIVAPKGLEFPTVYVDEFGSFCGAGSGFGQIVVPETMWRLPISPACFVHDMMWDMAPPTWEAFHASNAIFLRNLLALIQVQSKSALLKRMRMYRAVTYYNAVDSFGKKIFWNLKDEQASAIEAHR